MRRRCAGLRSLGQLRCFSQHRLGHALRRPLDPAPSCRRREFGRLRRLRLRGRVARVGPVRRLQHRVQGRKETLWVPVATSADRRRGRQSLLLDPVFQGPDADAENPGYVFTRQGPKCTWVFARGWTGAEGRRRANKRGTVCSERVGGGQTGNAGGRHMSPLKWLTHRLAPAVIGAALRFRALGKAGAATAALQKRSNGTARNGAKVRAAMR